MGPYFPDACCPTCKIVREFQGYYYHAQHYLSDLAFLHDRTSCLLGDICFSQSIRNSLCVDFLLGYQLVEAAECDLERLRRNDPILKTRCNNYGLRKTTLTLETLIRKLLKNEIYGLAQVDASVPDRLKSYFAQLLPVFKKTTIER